VKTAIVVVNWNDPEGTQASVREVADWGDPKPAVWVVDNASRRPFPQERMDGLDLHVIRSDINRGYGGGINLALREILEDASITQVLLLNTDAVIAESVLRRLGKAIQEDARIGAIGPILRESSGDRERLAVGGRDIARHMLTRRCVADESAISPRGRWNVDYVPGTVALVPAGAFRKVGLFDEEYFFSGEMADLCERLRREGLLCVVDTGVFATHGCSGGTLRETLYVYYGLRNRFLFVRKFGGTEKPLLLVRWVLCGLLMWVKACLAGPPGKARAARLGLWDGVQGRFGNCNDRFIS